MRISLAVVALLLAVTITGAWQIREGSAQGTPTLEVDANPDGNTATSVGPEDRCVSVRNDATFQVDILVTDVSNLQAWEVYFVFDPAILSVTDRDVKMFSAASAGSNVFDASESLPNDTGLYRIAAADIAVPSAPESGSGVLARLTLHAAKEGVSPAAIGVLDPNGDGRAELGPALWNPQGLAIGDGNGDGFFDGPLVDSQIAVDTDCPAGVETPLPTATTGPASPTAAVSPGGQTTPAPTPTPVVTQETASPTPNSRPETAVPSASPTPSVTAVAPDGDEGSTDWTSGPFVLAYVAGGGLAVFAVSGFAFLGARRRRS